MSTTDEHLGFLRDLVTLDPRPARAIAASCGVDQSNFSSFLRTGRDFPKDKVGHLYRVLRLSRAGELTPEVRSFAVGEDLGELERVLNHIPDGDINLVAIIERGEPRWNLDIPFHGAMYALWNSGCRICVTRSFARGGRVADTAMLSPASMPRLRWRQGPDVKAKEFATLTAAQLSRWRAGELSEREFDGVVSSPSEPTFFDIERLAARKGVPLAELYGFVAATIAKSVVVARTASNRKGR